MWRRQPIRSGARQRNRVPDRAVAQVAPGVGRSRKVADRRPARVVARNPAPSAAQRRTQVGRGAPKAADLPSPRARRWNYS
jgi:hypothetical protein